MKARIKSYLSITKKEWNGLVVFIILIALVLAAPYGYQLFHKDKTINLKDFENAAAQLGKPGSEASPGSNKIDTGAGTAHPVMFSFDPNTATTTQWEQLGLSGHQAEVIEHYKAKGGHFYNKGDVKKIYGLSAENYHRLEPYIKIPANGHLSPKIKPNTIIELNTTDSAKLTALPGIGPSYAVRIIRYRNRLGGFYDKKQVKEVYGMDSLLYNDIKNHISVNPSKVKRISINNISFAQLRIFPYLNYKQVNALIEYRNQHGNYTSIADIKNIVLLDDIMLHKIEPYINFK